METHFALRTHWDHEPTPNPSQEGNGQDADEHLLPSWEGPGVGRFMECPDGQSAAHWDHDPRNWSADLQVGAFGARRTAPSWSSALRFIERVGAREGQFSKRIFTSFIS